MTMIEAANPEEEALAIAVALREAVHDGKTAALVTPDRALGRRVLAALQRWNIAAEDSGGDALADTPAGIFARLAAAAALDGTPPVTLLALLKHPLLRLGEQREPWPRSSARSCAGRGRAPAAPALLGRWRIFANSSANIAARSRSICIHSDPRSDLTDGELAAADRSRDAARRGAGAARKPGTASAIRSANWPGAIATSLAALSRHGGDAVALAGRDGQKLADALDELATSEAAAGLAVETSDYVELFSAALAGRVVRRAAGRACACASSARSKRA